MTCCWAARTSPVSCGVFDGLVQYDQDIGRAKRATWGVSYRPSNYRTVSLAYRLQRNSSELVDLAWQVGHSMICGVTGEKT